MLTIAVQDDPEYMVQQVNMTQWHDIQWTGTKSITWDSTIFSSSTVNISYVSPWYIWFCLEFKHIRDYTGIGYTLGDAMWDSDIVWDTLNKCHFML